jgi:hypothetical protein
MGKAIGLEKGPLSVEQIAAALGQSKRLDVNPYTGPAASLAHKALGHKATVAPQGPAPSVL